MHIDTFSEVIWPKKSPVPLDCVGLFFALLIRSFLLDNPLNLWEQPCILYLFKLLVISF